MTAAARVARIGSSYPRPSTKAANEPKYPEPADPAIKTKADIAKAVFVWVGGVFLGLGLIALVAKVINALTQS